MIFIILAIVFAVTMGALDVYATSICNNLPDWHEKNKYFRTLEGKCNIGKLILWKAVYFAAFFVVCTLLYVYADAGIWAYTFFALIGLVHIPAVIDNFSYYSKNKPNGI